VPLYIVSFSRPSWSPARRSPGRPRTARRGPGSGAQRERMTVEVTTPIRAHHVGSLIRPAALIEARNWTRADRIADAERRRIQESAIRDAVRLQEDLGFRLVTDGEYNRNRWQADFLLQFENVALTPSKVPVKFHSAEGVREHTPPTLEIRGRLARPKAI